MSALTGCQAATDHIAILRCPITHSPVRAALGHELEVANARSASGAVSSVGGKVASRLISRAVVGGDRFLYPVIGGVYLLLPAHAIPLTQGWPGSPPPESPYAQIKDSVRDFYDQVGWQPGDQGFADAELFEDLRDISARYRHAANLRVAQQLPGRGRFLLDAASGPIQYQDYLDFSANYDVRVCVDLSLGALQVVKQKLGERALCVVGDVTNLPLRDDTVDAFVSLHTLYHVPEAEQRTAFLELHRVLQPGGAGVVVYSWGGTSFTQLAQVPIRLGGVLRHLLARISSPARRSLGGSHDESPSPYFRPHTYGWFRRQRWPFDYRILAWRSLSLPMLRFYVRDSALGRYVLERVKCFEDRFPGVCGRWGPYPLIAIRKRLAERGDVSLE